MINWLYQYTRVCEKSDYYVVNCLACIEIKEGAVFVMDKLGKNLGVLVLGVLFFIAALIYGRNRLTDSNEENKDKENGTSFPFEKIYMAGEEVTSINVVCQLNRAEFLKSYAELDSFYQKRHYLVKPEEYLMRKFDFEGIFPEDVRFIHLNFSLTNHSEMKKIFVPDKLKLTSISSNYESLSWGEFFASDGKYQIEKKNGTIKKVDISGKKPDCEESLEILSILPEETVVIDFVGEFLLCGREDGKDDFNSSSAAFIADFFERGDLYLSISGLGTEISTGQNLRGEKIRLDINCEPPRTDAIQTAKSRSWTNLERSENQIQSCSFDSVQEEMTYPYVKLFHTYFQNENMVEGYKEVGKLLNYQFLEWKNLPKEYVQRGNLQQMAERYKDIYGYETEELKVLFLNVEYSAEVIGNTDLQKHAFYENSVIYLRKNETEWYLFGTADEWKVTENSAFPEKTGFLNSEWLADGERLRVELIYLLPPDVYRQQKEIYFFGGYPLDIWNIPKNTPVTKISL